MYENVKNLIIWQKITNNCYANITHVKVKLKKKVCKSALKHFELKKPYHNTF